MMMDVDKFDTEDVWDDALFSIDDEPDSPAGVADFEVEKCELKPHNAPLLPDIVPSFADGFDEACEKAAASMPGDLFPQMVSPVASPATLPDMGLSGVALRVAQAFGAEHGVHVTSDEDDHDARRGFRGPRPDEWRHLQLHGVHVHAPRRLNRRRRPPATTRDRRNSAKACRRVASL